jgi:tetratricopeptide (TPR) repeat protein
MKQKLTSLILCLLLCGTSAYAQKKTFTRDYTYQASEADSKLSARAIATTEMRNILLREVGEFLHAERTLRQTETSQEYSEKTEALTAGIVEMKTLDEQWNGVTYYIKAEMTVDPEDVNRRIAEVLNDKQKTQELEASRQRIKDAEAEIERLKKKLANADNLNNAALKEAYHYQTGILASNEYITRGNIALNNKWEQEAIAEYDKAYAQMPDNEATHRFMGDIYMKLYNNDGDDRAIKCYEKYLGTNPDGEKLIFLGDVCEKLAEHYNSQKGFYELLKNRSKEFKDIYEKYKNRSEYHYKKAESYFKRAESYYKNVIMNDPNNAGAYIKLVDMSFKFKNYESLKNIERYIQKVISIDPTYKASSNYSSMGFAYADLKYYREAIACYQKAIEIDPKDRFISSTYRRMINAYLELKDYKGIIESCKKAIDINPEGIWFYYIYMGNAYKELKDYKEAIQCYQKAIDSDTERKHIWSYHYMGLCHISLGNKQEGIKCIQKGAQLGDKEAQEWLRNNGYSW